LSFNAGQTSWLMKLYWLKQQLPHPKASGVEKFACEDWCNFHGRVEWGFLDKVGGDRILRLNKQLQFYTFFSVDLVSPQVDGTMQILSGGRSNKGRPRSDGS